MRGGTAIRPDHVAIYIRWSTDDQATGTTLEVQREACEHYVKSQGWQVQEDLIFIDDGYSGGSLDRPAMTALRQQVQQGEVDCVVVLKIDRLSRNIVDAVDLVLREWHEKCHLKSAREPIDTQNDLGRMIFGILAMFADYERAQIRERTLSGKERRIKEGQQMHARPAYGYRTDPEQKGRWIEDPETAENVRRIFQWAYEGHSAGQICRMLNAEGVLSPRGRQWSVRSVLWILQNRAYIGEAVYGRTSLLRVEEPAGGSRRRRRVEHAVPKFQGQTAAIATPIIARDLFDAVQHRLEARQRERRSMGSRGLSSPHLLVGIAQCRCGAALVHKAQDGRGQQTYRHYVCHKSRYGACALSGHIPAQQVEAILESLFLNLYGIRQVQEERFARSLEAADLERRALAQELTAAQQALRGLDAERRALLREARRSKVALEELRDLLEAIDADRLEREAGVAKLRHRLDEVERRLRTLRSTLKSLGAAERWALLEPRERRQLIRMALAERVTIWKEKGSGQVTIQARWVY